MPIIPQDGGDAAGCRGGGRLVAATQERNPTRERLSFAGDPSKIRLIVKRLKRLGNNPIVIIA